MHFGATLRLLRLDSGLSLRDLARRLALSGAYLSRVENGLDAVPTPARLEAMARELGIPPTVLMALANRVSPLVVDYVQDEPDAGALFLEIAHQRLDAGQLAEVRAFVNERFSPRWAIPAHSCVRLSDLLTPERVVVRFTCSNIDDVLDVAAGRLGAPRAAGTAALRHSLKRREHEVPSTLGGGVAVPCAYVEGVPPAAVLVTLAAPLAYECPDDVPLRVVIVMAGPRDSVDRRLRIAHVARLAGRGLADRLARARSVGEAMSCLALLEPPADQGMRTER